MKKPVTPPAHAHLRDATGHLEPRYAADLQALGQAGAEPQDPVAFPDADIRRDALAEELGEGFVRTALSGEDEEMDRLDADEIEEVGGPFVMDDTDASNPEDESREPFPQHGRGP
jgi:hypothetical protein